MVIFALISTGAVIARVQLVYKLIILPHLEIGSG